MAILARPGFIAAAELERPAVCSAVDPETAAIRARVTVLYAEHGSRIHRFLRDLLGDAALASDATQETFVRAYRKLAAFEASDGGAGGGGGRIAPWLFGIARNVSLELRKARVRAGRHLVAVSSLEEAMEQIPGPITHSPERSLLGREALTIVGTALEKLPEERRAMLLLRLDHGLSYEDIAETMSCSLAKVKVEIFRAREVLRSVMADYEQAGPKSATPSTASTTSTASRGGAR